VSQRGGYQCSRKGECNSNGSVQRGSTKVCGRKMGEETDQEPTGSQGGLLFIAFGTDVRAV
jgi:hypothetical protein